MSSNGTNIHFFKKIEEDTLRKGKLRIPRSFVSKCWEGISNPVLLILPNYDKWNVMWKKDDAVVWLIHGWKKFVEFYSLDPDHFLVFKYVGQSKFQVVIFDQSGLEIEYPLKKRTLDCEEIVNPFCQSKREKSPLPFSSSKKEKSNSTSETNYNPREDVEALHAQSHITKVHAEELKENGGRWIMHANTNGKFSKSKAIQGEENDNRSALERAKAFHSENPFFIRQMSTTYIQNRVLSIPSKFITEDQRNEDNSVTLWISGERTWRVYFRMNRSNGQTRLTHGWMDFINDNNLKIGNVCVFEQVKNPGISFKVVIYRDREISRPSMFPACEDGTNLSKQRASDGISKEYYGNNVFDGSELSRCNNEVSENHFTITITPVEYYNKNIPIEFIRNHDIDIVKKGTLLVGKGSWPVEFVYYASCNLCRFGSGWSEFKRDCGLEVGDICYFKLIDKREFVFQVIVTRCIG